MPHLDLRDNLLNGLAVPNTTKAKNVNTRVTTRPIAAVDQNKYTTAADMDTALLAAGYTQARLDGMTQNDKVFALRQVHGTIK